MLTVSMGYLFLISIPENKLPWYDAPVLPMLSMMAGISIFFLMKQITMLIGGRNLRRIVMAGWVVLVAVYFYFPYDKILRANNYWRDFPIRSEYEGHLMRQVREKHPDIIKYTVLKNVRNPDEHYDQIKFYQRIYRNEYDYDVSVEPFEGNLKPGSYYLVSQEIILEEIDLNFTRVIFENRFGKLFLFEGRNQNSGLKQ
jgi:hypothetical protein